MGETGDKPVFGISPAGNGVLPAWMLFKDATEGKKAAMDIAALQVEVDNFPLSFPDVAAAASFDQTPRTPNTATAQ